MCHKNAAVCATKFRRIIEMANPVTVFYHADCLDGFGAAYAAWRYFGDTARYRALHHGDAWSPDEVKGHDVYILDFSFPPDALGEMAKHAASVVQIDHHASALAPWRERMVADAQGRQTDRHDTLNLIFDLNKSGARLAWEYFHPSEAVPLPLLHIEDQDLWRFTLPGTRAFCRALRLQSFTFAAWDELIRDATNDSSPGYRETLRQGEAIEGFFAREVERLAAGPLRTPARLRGEPVDAMQALRHGQTVISDGEQSWLAVNGVAINASVLFASELGNALAEQSGSFGAVWQIGRDGEAKVSLRSKGDFDVSAIAVRYGGGGHRNAAGFRLPVGQFLAEVLAMVPRKGLEPPRISTPEPKSGASTNFATWASGAHSSTD